MILKRLIFTLLFALFAYYIVFNAHLSTIIAGIAIFMIGMYFLDNGFGLFSGGILERILEKSTSTLPKAVGTGALITAIAQSSSLISVIVISFLSAELIGLTQAIGVVFGSNIGTTATAWIVSAFGLKIKIAHYAMPMITLGVMLRFFKEAKYKGIGDILTGLGFIFLGIGYMKEGFDVLKEGFDLSQYSLSGVAGLLVYTLIGALMTIVLQSSSATVALILTALSAGQIIYINALTLAIGANIGTTVTAAIGSITSNENGKRLAVAHAIFNLTTASVALLSIHWLAKGVDILSIYIGIEESDYLLKLALFHTIFNVLGVLIMIPFMPILVRFLKTLFVPKKSDSSKPKYLDDTVIMVPSSAIVALKKELARMYDKSLKTLAHAISLHRKEIFSEESLQNVIDTSSKRFNTDVNMIYKEKLKGLYSEIIHFSSLSQQHMSESDNKIVSEYKLVARNIIEVVKDIRELQKNINHFFKSKNQVIKSEYNFIRKELAHTLKEIEFIRKYEPKDLDKLSRLEILKQRINELDYIESNRVSKLLQEKKIDSRMATSLLNDSAFAHSIAKKLLFVAAVLWIEDRDIFTLGDDNEY